jgi:hypothetical protein
MHNLIKTDKQQESYKLLLTLTVLFGSGNK